ncbi:TetR/AcrR family transcriptional regulator [Blastomonas sp.]|uniref:TetR/AcrR family transcriptional regulator n=1 Tax=Blastomonas sp. TaxID=1909299 RepID=UPI003593FF07
MLGAVETIVLEQGIEAVTIRAAAKAIGVSHAAAFRHFTDKRALLTAFATQCAGELAEYMEHEVAGQIDPQIAFYRAGVGYMRFALDRPGAFRTVFRDALIDTADKDYCAAMARLELLLLGGTPQSERKELPLPALLAWGATHGLATLAADGALNDLPPSSRSIEGLAAALALLRKSLG